LPRPFDVAVAAGAVVVALIDIGAPTLFKTHIAGPYRAVVGCWLISAVALAWRRIAPMVVLCVVLALVAVPALLWGPSSGNASLLPVLVAAYSVGALAARRPAYVGLALLVAVMVVRELCNPANVDWASTRTEIAFDLTVVMAWCLGSWVRTRRLYEAALLERTAQAERAREQETSAAIAEERLRIARDLHDSIAHRLTVIVVTAEAADEALGRDPASVRTPLRRIEETSRDALVEMREVLGGLRDDRSETSEGGVGAIEGLVAAAGRSGLGARLVIDGRSPVPPPVDRAAYRIVQEALTNVLKHSSATTVDVTVDYASDRVRVDVTDPGPGAGSPLPGSGVGLRGMAERVAELGGVVEAGQTPRGGFRVYASIPTGTAQTGTRPTGMGRAGIGQTGIGPLERQAGPA
jgi:signal transduction histidine kinase